MLFWPSLCHFWRLVTTLVTFNSNLNNFERRKKILTARKIWNRWKAPKNPKNFPKSQDIFQKLKTLKVKKKNPNKNQKIKKIILFFVSLFFNQKFFYFVCWKNAILLVLAFKEISLWSELSSPPCSRIQGGGYPKRYIRRRTGGNPCVIYWIIIMGYKPHTS